MQMNFAEHNGTFCFGDIPKWLLRPPPPPISGRNIDEVTEKETDLIKKYCGEGRQRGSVGVGGGGGLRGGGQGGTEKEGRSQKSLQRYVESLAAYQQRHKWRPYAAFPSITDNNTMRSTCTECV